MHSSERIEEMVCELEGYRWDAICGDKKNQKSGRHKHIFMGAGKYDNKQGVGIMLNKKWRQRIIDTEHINERAITATKVVNRRRIKLMSVYFLHSGYADHHIEKCSKRSRSTRHINQETILQIQRRRRSQRHDPCGKGPQMCHGNFHDHHERDQTGKNIEVEKLELEKYQKIIEKIKRETAATKKAAQAENENAEAKAKNDNAAAEAKSENTEAEAEEVEGTRTGTMMNDGAETTGEAGGRHLGLHTVNEEAGHIVFYTEHVEHDMNDDTGERTKMMHNTTNANGEQTEIVIENENADAEAEA